jgi:ATP-binding cassette subfamily F protein 3
MKNKKGKALQNRLSKVESQIKQLEKDIQHDDKMLASNYNKNIEDASFFKAYNKRKQSWISCFFWIGKIQDEIDEAIDIL